VNRHEIEQKIIDIVRQQFDVNAWEIGRETKFSDLGADSLDWCEIVMACEDEFELAITDMEADPDKHQTVGDAISFIFGKLAWKEIK